jgi:hypothetical protein
VVEVELPLLILLLLRDFGRKVVDHKEQLIYEVQAVVEEQVLMEALEEQVDLTHLVILLEVVLVVMVQQLQVVQEVIDLIILLMVNTLVEVVMVVLEVLMDLHQNMEVITTLFMQDQVEQKVVT